MKCLTHAAADLFTQRDEGAATAHQRLTVQERQAVQRAILALAESREWFSSDDVMGALSDGLVDRIGAFPNAIGGAMLGAARAGLIESTGHVIRSTRLGARARNILLWRKRPL
jgi:hypothetical protein